MPNGYKRAGKREKPSGKTPDFPAEGGVKKNFYEKTLFNGAFFLSFKKNLQQQATLILRKYPFLQKAEKSAFF